MVNRNTQLYFKENAFSRSAFPNLLLQVVLEFFVKRAREMGDRLVHSYRYRKHLRNVPASPHRPLERISEREKTEEVLRKSLDRDDRDSRTGSEPSPPGVETFETTTCTLSAKNKPGMGLSKNLI